MTLHDFFSAVSHAAATVYHHVLSVEADAKQWSIENPVVGGFIAKGVDTANAFFEGLGVSAPTVKLVETGIIAALKHLAAGDATANSLTTTPSAPVPAPVPAPVVAAKE